MLPVKAISILACIGLSTTHLCPAQTPTFTTLHAFHSAPPEGSNLESPLIEDAAGNFYGTAWEGGAHGLGVVFEFTATGQQKVLYSFPGGESGGNPSGALALDSAGNLYGTTRASIFEDSDAVVFELSASGIETVLHVFSKSSYAGSPQGVVLDAEGNLYGSTDGGGLYNYGQVYKLSPAGVLTTLYSFTGYADGSQPEAGLLRDSAGNIYGTTALGGVNSCGVVFELSPSGRETVLYSFQGGPEDGEEPNSTLVRDAKGNFYGTTSEGGSGFFGTVYKLTASGQETVLHSFGVTTDDGEFPEGVTLDAEGNLYGTTETGIAPGGVIFELSPTGVETILYTFTGESGKKPAAGAILDASGNLYGTTQNGGIAGVGVVYKLASNGEETVWGSFPGPPGGTAPSAVLMIDSEGNLYGTTESGGVYNSGTVFRLSPTGQETVLYVFTGREDGKNPVSALAMDSAGNLYGTARSGAGTSQFGAVFQVNPAGQETVLHGFTGGADGSTPESGVILDAEGNMYGTTENGGSASNSGIVYKLDPAGNETILHVFQNKEDGSFPMAGLLLSGGNLYGTTRSGGRFGSGTVYEINAAGDETVLYSFQDDSSPYGGVIQDSSGNLFGTTADGGAHGQGAVYKLSPAGEETVLYSFTGGSDGELPECTLLFGSGGVLYGTTLYANDANGLITPGVVFGLAPTGALTVLHEFGGGLDGSYPLAGLISDSLGNLYGTASQGGIEDAGVVFKLNPICCQ